MLAQYSALPSSAFRCAFRFLLRRNLTMMIDRQGKKSRMTPKKMKRAIADFELLGLPVSAMVLNLKVLVLKM